MKNDLYTCALRLIPAFLCGLLCPGLTGGMAQGTSTLGLPKSPSGTIGPALDQPRITRYPVVRFLALFDRPLSGLTPDKIKVTGLVGGTVQVERSIELGGTGFLITVSDLERSGDVGVEIPAGVGGA